MYKIIGILLLLAITIVNLLLNSVPGEELENKVNDPPKVIMKIGHNETIFHPLHQALLKFKETVETNTKKEVEVQIFPNGQLGNSTGLIQALKEGTLNAVCSETVESAAPELLIYSMPFLFNDIESAHKITRGPIGKKIAQASKKNNIIILATGDASNNNVNNEPSDSYIPGSLPNDSIFRTLAALGAKNLPSSSDELNSIKQKNNNDPEKSSPETEDPDWKYLQNYLTSVHCQYWPEFFYANLEWYNSLPSAYQNVIKVAAEEMMLDNDDLLKQSASLTHSKKINSLSYEQRERYLEQVKPVYNHYIKIGLFTEKDLEEIRNLEIRHSVKEGLIF